MIRDYLSTATLGLGPDPKSPLNDLSTMNKTMEYMAFGLPVVSFDLKETRYSAGDASVYVEDEDIEQFAREIRALLNDPPRREQMGRSGRRRIVEVLAWSRQIPGYVAVYDGLVGRRSGPATVPTDEVTAIAAAAPAGARASVST